MTERERGATEDQTTLRELRQQSGKTRAEVAKALGVAVRTISHYECGTRKLSIEQVLVLAKLYDESAEQIILAQLNSHQRCR